LGRQSSKNDKLTEKALMKKLALHWKILIGMALGVLFGLIAAKAGWNQFVLDWIKPFGTIFINALKLIAVPLIIASLVKGISDLKDISQLSKMGGRTIGIYMITTVLAVVIGLLIVNTIQPGKLIEEDTRTELLDTYGGEAGKKIEEAMNQKRSRATTSAGRYCTQQHFCCCCRQQKHAPGHLLCHLFWYRHSAHSRRKGQACQAVF
jgi:hypothetical protein